MARIEAMEDPLNFGDVVAPKVAFNFGYPTTHMAYKAGLKGTILGDKKYFGSLTGLALSSLPDEAVTAYFTYGTKTLNIVFKTPDMGSFNLRVIGLDGRQFSSRQITNFGQTVSKIDLNELNSGFYIYEIDGVSINGIKRKVVGKVIL